MKLRDDNTNTKGIMGLVNVIGFNHGLPWCVKYMALGPPVTTKPDGEAVSQLSLTKTY